MLTTEALVADQGDYNNGSAGSRRPRRPGGGAAHGRHVLTLIANANLSGGRFQSARFFCGQASAVRSVTPLRPTPAGFAAS